MQAGRIVWKHCTRWTGIDCGREARSGYFGDIGRREDGLRVRDSVRVHWCIIRSIICVYVWWVHVCKVLCRKMKSLQNDHVRH